jgi:hypothetical protein
MITVTKNKTVKISETVFNLLEFMKKRDKKESINDLIRRLRYSYDWQVKLSSKSVSAESSVRIFLIEYEGREIPYPDLGVQTHIIRINEESEHALNCYISSPDETYNTVFLKMLTCYYKNKPIYRVFSGYGCYNCKCLIDYAKELLENDPKLKDAFNLEVVEAENFDSTMREYNATMLPLSVLYDAQFKPVWSASGFHNRETVKTELSKAVTAVNKF